MPTVMTSAQLLYVALLAIGLFLIGAEIYLPGGLVGFLGVLALLAAAIMGGSKFPSPYDVGSVVLVIILAGVCIWLWIRFFPRSKLGQKLTLNTDESQFKAAAASNASLLNQEGEALSPLRPAGLALLAGQRIDVVAESSWIPTGARVRVIEVAGNRIVVRHVVLSANAHGDTAP